MHRIGIALFATAVLLAQPVDGTAQMTGEPRLRVQPFAGYAFDFTRKGSGLFFAGDDVAGSVFDSHYEGGLYTGLTLDWRASSWVGFHGSFAYNPRGELFEHEITSDGEEFFFLADGPDLFFAKAGLAFRFAEAAPELQLHRIPSVTVIVAPAWLLEIAADDDGSDNVFEKPIYHWAGSFGVEAQVPLRWKGVVFTAAFEDFITMWRASELESRIERFNREQGVEVRANLDLDRTHVTMVRAGLSFSF